MIDRLSIMALKIRAMRQQTERTDAANEHVESCRLKLMRFEEQRTDLGRCLGELLADAESGTCVLQGVPSVQDVQRPDAQSLPLFAQAITTRVI